MEELKPCPFCGNAVRYRLFERLLKEQIAIDSEKEGDD
jgi:hypothetical protein